MKLWYISQRHNNDYDTYDSAVVAAETAEIAQTMHPGGATYGNVTEDVERFSSWAPLSKVEVELIGEALAGTIQGVICASFNAG